MLHCELKKKLNAIEFLSFQIMQKYANIDKMHVNTSSIYLKACFVQYTKCYEYFNETTIFANYARSIYKCRNNAG